ncbi:hypothetical protein HDU92_001627 [Lobulomyces angularis]|nr:hypothetical protein HDU92_001627 [Lobulomyces angularis]
MLQGDNSNYSTSNGIIEDMLAKNEEWVNKMNTYYPGFFEKSNCGQQPKVLFITCSDSRVCPTDIIGKGPGDLFVTRNIANVVVHTDLSLLSVLQYSVEVLKVEHVIVCGHYNCGGVKAVVEKQSFGLIDSWLMHINDVTENHKEYLASLNENERFDAIVELNCLNSVKNLSKTSIIRNAWKNNQNLKIHSWIYSLKTGRISDLNVVVNNENDADSIFKKYKLNL